MVFDFIFYCVTMHALYTDATATRQSLSIFQDEVLLYGLSVFFKFLSIYFETFAWCVKTLLLTTSIH